MSTDVRRPLGDSGEVAEYLKVPKRTLDDWAHQRRAGREVGPRFVRVGRHRRYRWADVEAWLDGQVDGGGEAA